MPRPYSDDLRLRVVETVENAASRRQAAEFFKVTVSFVIKLLQRVQATGEVPPARLGGYEVSPLKAHEEDLRLWIAERSDITIAELQSRLSERGTKTSPAALARCHERLGLTRKKDAESRRAVARGHRHGRAASEGCAHGGQNRHAGADCGDEKGEWADVAPRGVGGAGARRPLRHSPWRAAGAG